MAELDDVTSRVADLVAAARRGGADAADALYVRDASTQLSIRLGKLEDVQRSDGEDLGLRVFVGRRSASVSSSDLSAPALAALVERAVAMAREAPEDPYAGLAPADRLATGTLPDVDANDGGSVGPAELRARAETAEAAARGVAGVTNSEGAGASASQAVVALATSEGFARAYATTGYGCSASVIAGEGGTMQRDYAYHSARYASDLDDPAEIGRRAGERAVARLNPVRLPSGAMPVVFDPRVGASLLGHLVGAITGSAIARRTSFLLDMLGESLFSPGIVVVDDPHRPRGLRSRPFDGEGLPTRRSADRFRRPCYQLADGGGVGAAAGSGADRTCHPRGRRPAGCGGQQPVPAAGCAGSRRAARRYQARRVRDRADRARA
jgi:PmbA protein